MHAYRTHTCGELAPRARRPERPPVRLGESRRDHGGLLFIDLRDHYGLTQCVIEPDAGRVRDGRQARSEWVLTLTGKVVARSAETTNKDLPTGEVEIRIEAGLGAGPGAGICRCRCSANSNIPKTPASNTASSTCAANGCTRTLLCARRSFPRSAGA
jgi:hypothetical protein